MRSRSFWLALTVAVASSVAVAVCVIAGYYESRVIPRAEAQAAQEVADEAFEALRGPEKTGLVQFDPDLMVLAEPEAGNARPWWIAGGSFTFLAGAAVAVAVARRRTPD